MNKGIILAIASILTFSFGHSVSPNADEEAVLVKQPWFFGHGGVDMTPIKPGLTWCAWSTHGVSFKIVPEKHEVFIDDLFSDDNTPLDFHSVIITQVIAGKSPVLLSNYGEKWFETNLYNYFCNLVRDHISQHSPFDLMSNREVLNTIDQKIAKQMQDYVNSLSKTKEMPIIIKDVIIPCSKITIREMIAYFFINSMVTISAVTFLFNTDTMPLSLMINVYEGNMMLGEAAIVSLIILFFNLIVKGGIYLINRREDRKKWNYEVNI